ncbi:restriction endonuclease subunit S [Campylobacter sp. MOP51]|uniref:restriction endonuclease subunit S n=1 Tax=Campylobacter canis TaxID=3378588 RepID=UPI003C439C23
MSSQICNDKLPQGWEIVRLGEVCDVRDGTHDSPKYTDFGIPLVTSKNIVNGNLDLTEISYITQSDADKINERSKVDINDILMSMIGTIGSAILVNKTPNFCIKNVALFKPNHSKISAVFLVQLIQSKIFKNALNASLDGGIQKFISLLNLRNFKISIPKDIAVQDRIAQVLGDFDELISAKIELIDKKRAIKEATAQQLLTPKPHWHATILGEIVEIFDNLRIPIAASLRKFGTTPYYGANGIQDYVDGFTHNGEFVLIAEDGANDLINYPVCYVNGKIWVNNHAHVVSGKNKIVDNKFLSYCLKMTNFSKFLVGGTRAKLNGSIFKKIEISIPNHTEQIKISQILSDMDDEISALQDEVEKLKMIKQSVMSELLSGKIRLKG